jgi:hypothetical protein
MGAVLTFESKRDIGTQAIISIAVISELSIQRDHKNFSTEKECHETV